MSLMPRLLRVYLARYRVPVGIRREPVLAPCLWIARWLAWARAGGRTYPCTLLDVEA